MKKYVFLVFIFVCINATKVLFAQSARVHKAIVKIKIYEASTKAITPAMVCITNSNRSQVVTPPLGTLVDKPSDNDVFFKGVEFEADKKWVGPGRLTSGRGNNKDRSVLYGIQPSIPYWKAPVMYQTSGEFSLALPAGIWQINIEHGNEYLPITADIVVKKTDAEIKKTYTLRR